MLLYGTPKKIGIVWQNNKMLFSKGRGGMITIAQKLMFLTIVNSISNFINWTSKDNNCCGLLPNTAKWYTNERQRNTIYAELFSSAACHFWLYSAKPISKGDEKSMVLVTLLTQLFPYSVFFGVSTCKQGPAFLDFCDTQKGLLNPRWKGVVGL